jgi:hypothetical protein
VDTFVVQIWVSADPGSSRGELHGFVEQVGSGRRERFRSAQELIKLFELDRSDRLRDPTDLSRSQGDH